MITVFTSDFNSISQRSYDNLISDIQIHQLECPCCGHLGQMSYYGRYKRHVFIGGERPCLYIQRVKCGCGHTHALLPSSIIPYSDVMFWAQVFIALNGSGLIAVTKLMNAGVNIDERTARYIWRNYILKWKQRLSSYMISLSGLPSLVSGCFRCFSRQFMQIKHTPNILFQSST